VPTPRLLWLLLVPVALQGCRTHEAEDGTYQFALTEVIRDECGLAAEPGIMSTGTLVTTGNTVAIDYGFLGIKLVGTYLQTGEQMTMDGTAVNVRTQVRGQSCLEDTVAVHLDATTKSPTEFDGVMSFSYDTRQPDECVCQFWLRYAATRQGATP